MVKMSRNRRFSDSISTVGEEVVVFLSFAYKTGNSAPLGEICRAAIALHYFQPETSVKQRVIQTRWQLPLSSL